MQTEKEFTAETFHHLQNAAEYVSLFHVVKVYFHQLTTLFPFLTKFGTVEHLVLFDLSLYTRRQLFYYVSPHSPGSILSSASHGQRPHLAHQTITLSNQSIFFRYGYFTVSSSTGMDTSIYYTHRPVILQLDLKPMQQLAARNPYFNILAPKVAGNLSTETYDSLFQTFKVIYPDYARSHFVSDLKTVVTDTILQRWSIHLQVTDFYMMIDTDQGAQMLDDLPHSLLDILNWYYPSWKTHHHLDAFTSRECSPLVLTPHPDPHDTGFAVQIQVIPRGHPFVTATRSTKTAV